MSFRYPIKHWLTSLFVGPVIMIAYDAVDNSELMNDAVIMYLLFIAYGIYLSLPTFILYAVTYNLIIKTNKTDLTIKAILDIVGVLGIVVTFLIISGSMTDNASISYSIALVIGSFFYKVRQRNILIDS